MLENNKLAEFVADSCVELVPEVDIGTPNGDVLDDCAPSDRILARYVLLRRELDEYIFDEDVLAICVLKESITNEDTPESIVFDDCTLTVA